MEFVLGGLAACGAGCFTNPLEVVKTRMQLQGELMARGQYTVHYRNVFQAFFNIAKVDGILALQKGLVPALCYQFFMNGVRLGAYQWLTKKGFTKNPKGDISLPRCVAAGAVSGVMGAAVGSPMYMIKTHLQALSSKEIAVGFQHQHSGMRQAVVVIYNQWGIRGLFRGISGAVPRVMVGSAAQLSTFSTTKQYLEHAHIFPNGSLAITVLASMSSGAMAVMFMTPFDVVSTRLYNQGTDARGRGLCYRGVADCFHQMVSAGRRVGILQRLGAIALPTRTTLNPELDFRSGSWLNAICAAMTSGLMVVIFMTPFDVVSTRLYNQGTDSSGKGLYYRGVIDCFAQIFKKEGLWGFYKGWVPSLFPPGTTHSSEPRLLGPDSEILSPI